MRGFLKITFVFFIIFRGVTGGSVDYREEMLRLIKTIRRESPEGVIVIQQNAADLYFSDGKLVRERLEAVDGISQESIFYGDPEYNSRTPGEYRRRLEKYLTDIEKTGRSVMVTNYTDTFWGKYNSKRKAAKLGFVNYNVPDREVSLINASIPDENQEDTDSLGDVKNLLYLLNPQEYRSKKSYIEALAETNYDLLVIDAFFKGKPLKREEVERLRQKRDGGRRLVVAYFSIGEAEDYRYYWRDEWKEGTPRWIVEENKNWEGNYVVRYWDDEWHAIIKDYLERILGAGFDGVFLDTVDSYYYYIYPEEF